MQLRWIREVELIPDHDAAIFGHGSGFSAIRRKDDRQHRLALLVHTDGWASGSLARFQP